ncbi:putative serine/threonine-protein kinase-like protein CCR3 [Solanum dulcamara]|uniref:putative serine/threonine-protein kinase-like protein CCR3 n=1 Tax=Solanum dulcamara TaxID=45834 RepID=UPI002484EA20|nr:putative serine/threonine-protein kinase-like protein CCR3 [Solanum dulcamara]
MTASVATVVFTAVNIFIYVQALGGSSTTLAVVYGGAATICGIVANQPIQTIQCWRDNQSTATTISPDVSFDFIAGGLDGFAAVRSGGFSLLSWNTSFVPKRLYFSNSTLLTTVTMGGVQICGSTQQNATCWRGDSSQQPNGSSQFISISSGSEFSCGVLESSNRVVCWGKSDIASTIQSGFGNETMMNIYAGGRHACGLNTTGFLICSGDNKNGQLDVPSNMSYEYFGLALGMNHTCGIRSVNRTVVCWGGNGAFSSNVTEDFFFESVAAGSGFTCGLTTNNFSVVCWGPDWTSNMYPQGIALPLPMILPGPCVQSNCTCGIYPQSQNLCFGNGNICRHCDFSVLAPPTSLPPAPPPLAPSSPSKSKRLRRGLLAFAIVGSVGTFAGICSIIYFLWAGGCFGKKKVYNSVQPTITATSNGGQLSSSSPISRSSTLRRQGSLLMRRQRSGTSSKHTDRAEEFLFTDLAAATNNFSLENKIGAGSFGVVYKGKLSDGREVAIKRGETGPRTKKFQEKESAFDSELAFLSRLHHKHLVRLVGYCEERDERLLVYEYMKNGALFDHLHDKNNVEKSSSIVNSWEMRIKIALDAARGIEYLHNYAVPPIIHRDIKSSNILIDANWIARVSDFGLSLMGPECNCDYSSRPMKAAGTVGYIDPEYYGLNVLTVKSDVYGLGVVLLELLTGMRAIFKSEENGGAPMSVVDFGVPGIMAGELNKILDKRVGPAEASEEVEAVELVAYTAMHCVHLEGRDRPTISDIVSNLERALAAFDDSHGSISSGPIYFVSD